MSCSCLDSAKGECCASCRYGECHGCTYPQAIDCRRHAPTLISNDRRRVWPQVDRSECCGDYRPRNPIAVVAQVAMAQDDGAGVR